MKRIGMGLIAACVLAAVGFATTLPAAALGLRGGTGAVRDIATSPRIIPAGHGGGMIFIPPMGGGMGGGMRSGIGDGMRGGMGGALGTGGAWRGGSPGMMRANPGGAWRGPNGTLPRAGNQVLPGRAYQRGNMNLQGEKGYRSGNKYRAGKIHRAGGKHGGNGNGWNGNGHNGWKGNGHYRGPRYRHRHPGYAHFYRGYWYPWPWWNIGDYGGGYDGVYGAADHVEWCLNRYRSYDPRSNTYMGYDGRRHRCNSPFD